MRNFPNSKNILEISPKTFPIMGILAKKANKAAGSFANLEQSNNAMSAIINFFNGVTSFTKCLG